MNAVLYIDKGKPVVSCFPEKLSDGSVVWNLDIGGRVVPCISEARADAAFARIAMALKDSTNNNILTL